jgi:hypothetical protein
MKIIQQGKLPTPTEPWWVGRQLICNNCSTVIELQSTDKGSVHDTIDRSPDGKRTATVMCPMCSLHITNSWPNRQ